MSITNANGPPPPKRAGQKGERRPGLASWGYPISQGNSGTKTTDTVRKRGPTSPPWSHPARDALGRRARRPAMEPYPAVPAPRASRPMAKMATDPLATAVARRPESEHEPPQDRHWGDDGRGLSVCASLPLCHHTLSDDFVHSVKAPDLSKNVFSSHLLGRSAGEMLESPMLPEPSFPGTKKAASKGDRPVFASVATCGPPRAC